MAALSRITHLTVLLLIAVAARAVAAGPRSGVSLTRPEAQAHVERAEQAYAARDYRTASAELAAAYALEPRRELLFAWAQAERLGGSCQQAIPLYEQFLSLGPPPAEASKASRQLEHCRALLGLRPAASTRPTVRPAVAPAPAPPRPWYRDWWGGALLVSSGVALATGTGFLASAALSESAAERASSYGAFGEHVQRADSHRPVGITLMSVGGALAVAAVLRYVFHVRAERRRVALVRLAGGGALALGCEL